MSRWPIMAYSVTVYAIFFATFLYLIAFVGDLPFAPLTVNRGGGFGPVATAVGVDLTLIALFGLQHSGMARRGFKRWLTGFVPAAVERSTYVLAASVMLMLMFVLWRPIPAFLWSADGVAAVLLWGLFALGWGIVLLSTFLINHFELFGLQQAWFNLRARDASDPIFRTPLLYKLVRHPIYLGFFIAFWSVPTMTAGGLLFAGGMSLFMLVGIQLEERDLIALFGERYHRYRREAGMLLPRLRRG
ncbi:methanethiol S-methyltransferase [Sphingomonas sp. LHG3406-1]|uniref:methanethiol S-methyltransferase n=1 Tax=Sphingomonas sp. LHG3406-1 TaxID=2804617 RepID=UPI002619B909|nr:methanethiol S-methyltransferase [Sphingomonas sp. LHG3406-1]